jgi:hypothetical protein
MVFLIASLAAASAASGETLRLLPTVTGFEGELAISGNDERSENTTNGKGLSTSDTYFTEKIVLTANGYVYHPRFLLFLAKLGGGLGQENFDSGLAADPDSGAWTEFTLWEYELRALMLPEHPYSLELFALRRNPFVPGRITSGIHPVENSLGALFTYKRMPWTLRIGYTFDAIDSGTSTTDTDTYHANAGYSLENFSLSGSYSLSDSRNQYGQAATDFTTEKYSLQNQIRLFDKSVFLTSDVSQNTYDQRNVLSSPSGTRFTWTEQLTMYLPWDFTALANYNHYKDTEESDVGAGGGEVSLTSTTDSVGCTLSKRLYESVYVAYNFLYFSMDTFSGDTSDTTNSLNAIYTKRIPRGRFTAGGIVSRSLSERSGAPAVLNEPHSAPIFGEFPLLRTDIDEASIRLSVRDPITGGFLPMQLGADYIIFHVGNTLMVQILSVPPAVLNPNPAFVYEFQVSYVLATEFTEVETTETGYSLKLELFDGLFTPYYSYDRRDQNVLAGIIPGGAEDVTTKTYGILLQGASVTLMLEHQDYQSNINPSKRDRAEATFRKDVTPNTNLNVRAFYTTVDYLEGGSQPPSPDETGTGGDIAIQARFPGRNLILRASGSYAQRDSVFDTEIYTLAGGLLWRVGKIDLAIGADYSSVDTAFDPGSQETTYQRVYFTLRRQLF